MLEILFYFKHRTDLQIVNLEAVWVEVHIKNKTILVGGFYRPPNASDDNTCQIYYPTVL